MHLFCIPPLNPLIHHTVNGISADALWFSTLNAVCRLMIARLTFQARGAALWGAVTNNWHRDPSIENTKNVSIADTLEAEGGYKYSSLVHAHRIHEVDRNAIKSASTSSVDLPRLIDVVITKEEVEKFAQLDADFAKACAHTLLTQCA